MIKIRDIFDEPIELTEQVWQDIIKKHPEVKGLKEKIPLTLSHPEIVSSYY